MCATIALSLVCFLVQLVTTEGRDMGKELKIGLIGLGYIGKIHTVAYRDIALCFNNPPVTARLAAVLRSRLDTEAEATQSYQLATTDPAEFHTQDLHVVDVCSPNFMHREQVEPALRAGRAVYCEKPLAANLEDAQALADLAKKTGALTQVAFTYRYLPAIRQMKAMIAGGEIGEVYHFRARMFHGSYLDTDRPMSWRLRHAESGGGAFMDLGVHLVDLTHYLLGRVETVRALSRTFVCERCTEPRSEQHEAVDVDDWMLSTLELKNGAVGVLEVTRVAGGSAHDTDLAVFGSKGAVLFEMGDAESARWFDPQRRQWIRGAINLPAVPGERPSEQVWPTQKYSQGEFTNSHVAAAYDFLLNVAEGKPSAVDFQAGLAAQEVVEAAYRSALRGGDVIRLPL
jgi:predicted dehydrogenase